MGCGMLGNFRLFARSSDDFLRAGFGQVPACLTPGKIGVNHVQHRTNRLPHLLRPSTRLRRSVSAGRPQHATRPPQQLCYEGWTAEGLPRRSFSGGGWTLETCYLSLYMVLRPGSSGKEIGIARDGQTRWPPDRSRGLCALHTQWKRSPLCRPRTTKNWCGGGPRE